MDGCHHVELKSADQVSQQHRPRCHETSHSLAPGQQMQNRNAASGGNAKAGNLVRYASSLHYKKVGIILESPQPCYASSRRRDGDAFIYADSKDKSSTRRLASWATLSRVKEDSEKADNAAQMVGDSTHGP